MKNRSKVTFVQHLNNFTVLVLGVGLVFLIFNNRRLSREIENYRNKPAQVIIITPPRDYEKEISEDYDSIRNVVRAIEYDSAVRLNDKFLYDLFNGRTTFGHIDSVAKGTSDTRALYEVRDSHKRDY